MTSATVSAQPKPANGFSRARRAFRNWRRTRPFWAGLLILLAAGPILYFPYASLSIGVLRIQMATTAGAGSAVIGLLLAALGISVWFQLHIRVFAGIAAIVLSLVSLPVSNFGGFGMGLLLGLLGGMLALSWAPLKAAPEAAPEAAAAPAEAVAEEETTPIAAMMQVDEAPTAVLPEQKTDSLDEEEAPRGE
ncbi:DUF6114 domain-containing protein [Streptacidiphilus monticola]|uniref:DUF6114 domain-containing protein n=1 Tax=Streptacidiphilus monticola TaxID=2161674 RepID=A0ABW1G127_9ACTN